MDSTKKALIIVDMQNDFLEGGSLEVKGGSALVPKINELHKTYNWDFVALSSDWHPKDHCSFQVNNPGSELFKPFFLKETSVEQVMWPVHCVQGSTGAKFHSDLEVLESDTIIQKGTIRTTDSYTAFGKNPEDTGLKNLLESKGIQEVYVCGVAFDYCVGNTALDALANGYKTFIIEDLTKSVTSESEQVMQKKIDAAGGIMIDSSVLLKS